MRDRLGKSRYFNAPALNKTQTIYTRFLKGPSGELKSGFTVSKEMFSKFGEDALRTRYTRMEG